MKAAQTGGSSSGSGPRLDGKEEVEELIVLTRQCFVRQVRKGWKVSNYGVVTKYFTAMQRLIINICT